MKKIKDLIMSPIIWFMLAFTTNLICWGQVITTGALVLNPNFLIIVFISIFIMGISVYWGM